MANLLEFGYAFWDFALRASTPQAGFNVPAENGMFHHKQS
jgi:hypothetical protein